MYIDFETLRQDPPNPGLLGVLYDETFEQLILDDRLRGAAVARRHCRAIAFSDAIAEITGRAQQQDRSVVGWSLFERRVVQSAGLRPDLEAAFVSRYVDGRAIATRWKSRLHPRVQVPRFDRFDPRNRLDRFAALTAYPHGSALQGTPAKWLRQVTSQLVAREGRYRRITPAARRSWRGLLEYNRHDCLALRHIVLRAAFELEKWNEYLATRFCVTPDAGRAFCFQVGSVNRKLQALLERVGADRWAFITAWNLGSVEQARSENDRRQTELLARLSAYRVVPGEGVGRDPAWAPEPSFLVLDIRRSEAIRIGRAFGQLAVVVGRKGSRARLVACAQLGKLPEP
jgi:hypothetical protein